MMEPKLVEGVAKGKQFMRVACGANHFAALSLGAHSCTRDKAFACENETVLITVQRAICSCGERMTRVNLGLEKTRSLAHLLRYLYNLSIYICCCIYFTPSTAYFAQRLVIEGNTIAQVVCGEDHTLVLTRNPSSRLFFFYSPLPITLNLFREWPRLQLWFKRARATGSGRCRGVLCDPAISECSGKTPHHTHRNRLDLLGGIGRYDSRYKGSVVSVVSDVGVLRSPEFV